MTTTPPVIDPLVRWEQIRAIGAAVQWERIGTNTMRVYLGNHPRERSLLFALDDETIRHCIGEWRTKLSKMFDPEKAVKAILDWADKRQLAFIEAERAAERGPIGCDYCDDGRIVYTGRLEAQVTIRPPEAYGMAALAAQRAGEQANPLEVALLERIKARTRQEPYTYDASAACPECNGGAWPIPKPPYPNYGEYREGWLPHEVPELRSPETDPVVKLFEILGKKLGLGGSS